MWFFVLFQAQANEITVAECSAAEKARSIDLEAGRFSSALACESLNPQCGDNKDVWVLFSEGKSPA